MNTENKRMDLQDVVEKILPGFSGMHGALVVAQKDRIIFHKTFTAHKAAWVPSNSLYPVASLTKNFTSVALLKVLWTSFGTDVKRALHRPVSDFLIPEHPVWPSPRPEWAQSMTLHHLLSHSSGIDTLDVPLKFPPGKRYHYSNWNYHLIGHVIHSLNHEPIDEYYQKALFQPAKMTDTAFMTQEKAAALKKDARWAPGFKICDGTLIKIMDDPDFSQLFTAGGIISTASDLAKWPWALHQERIVPYHILARMVRPVIQKEGFPFYDGTDTLWSGYGLDSAYDGTTTLYQHCAGTAGYQAKLSYDPVNHISMVHLSNVMEDRPVLFAFANELRRQLK